jgi:hypothetical protein
MTSYERFWRAVNLLVCAVLLFALILSLRAVFAN